MEFETKNAEVEDPGVDEGDHKYLNAFIKVEPEEMNDEYARAGGNGRDPNHPIADTVAALDWHTNDACYCEIEIKTEPLSSRTEPIRHDVAECIPKAVTSQEQPEPGDQNLINIKVEPVPYPVETVERHIQSDPFKGLQPEISMIVEKPCDKSVPHSWAKVKAESTSGPKSWAEVKFESSAEAKSTQNRAVIKVEAIPSTDEPSKMQSADAASLVLNAPDAPSTEGPSMQVKIKSEVKTESGSFSDEKLKEDDSTHTKLVPAEIDVNTLQAIDEETNEHLTIMPAGVNKSEPVAQPATEEAVNEKKERLKTLPEGVGNSEPVAQPATEETVKETKECLTILPEGGFKSENVAQSMNGQAVTKAKERIKNLALSIHPFENKPRVCPLDQFDRTSQLTGQPNDEYGRCIQPDPPHPECNSSYFSLRSLVKSAGLKGEKRGTFLIKAYHRGKDPYKLLTQLLEDDGPPWCGYIRGNHSRTSRYARFDKGFPHPNCKFTLQELKTMAEQIPESFGVETRMKFIYRCYCNGKHPSFEDWTQYSINPFYEFEDLPPHRNCHHSIDELKRISEGIQESYGIEARVQFVRRCYLGGKNPNTEDVARYRRLTKQLIINNPFTVKTLKGVELPEFEGPPHEKCKYSLDKIKDLAAQIPESLGNDTRVHFIRRCYRYGHDPMKEDWTKYFQPTPIKPPVNKDDPYAEFDSRPPDQRGSPQLNEIKRIAEQIPESFGIETRVKFIRRCYWEGKDPTTEDWTQYNVDPYFEIQEQPVHQKNKFSYGGLKKIAARIPESMGIWHRIEFVRRCYLEGKNPFKENWKNYNIKPVQPNGPKTKAFNVRPNNAKILALPKSGEFSARAKNNNLPKSFPGSSKDAPSLQTSKSGEATPRSFSVPRGTPLNGKRSLEELNSLGQQVGARMQLISHLNGFQRLSGPHNHNPDSGLGNISLDKQMPVAPQMATPISKHSEVQKKNVTPVNGNCSGNSSRLGRNSTNNLDHSTRRISMSLQGAHASTSQNVNKTRFQRQAPPKDSANANPYAKFEQISPHPMCKHSLEELISMAESQYKTTSDRIQFIHRCYMFGQSPDLPGMKVPTDLQLPESVMTFAKKLKRKPECKYSMKALGSIALGLPTRRMMKRFMFLTYCQGKEPYQTFHLLRSHPKSSIPSTQKSTPPSTLNSTVGNGNATSSLLGSWQQKKKPFSGCSKGTANNPAKHASMSTGGLILNNPLVVKGVPRAANPSPYGGSLVAPPQIVRGLPYECSPNPTQVDMPWNPVVNTPPVPPIPATGQPFVLPHHLTIDSSHSSSTAFYANPTAEMLPLNNPPIVLPAQAFNVPPPPIFIGLTTAANSSPIDQSFLSPSHFVRNVPNECSPEPPPVDVARNQITPPANFIAPLPSTEPPFVPPPPPFSPQNSEVNHSPNHSTPSSQTDLDKLGQIQLGVQQDNCGASSLERKLPYQSSAPTKRTQLAEQARTIENSSEDIDPLFIVPSGYPNERLSEDQMNTIENAILDAILDIDDGAKLAFKDSFRFNGRYGLVCNDDFTKRWICQFLKSYQPWPNASLRIVSDESKIRANAVLPLCKDDDEKILKFIGKQNAGLNVWEWKIVDRWDSSDSKTRMIFMVDEDSAKILQNHCHINFKFSFGEIVVAHEEAGSSGGGGYAPKAGVSGNRIKRQDMTKGQDPFRALDVAHGSRQRLPGEGHSRKPVQSSPSVERDHGKTAHLNPLYSSVSSDEDLSWDERARSRKRPFSRSSSSRHSHSKNHKKRACHRRSRSSSSSSSGRHDNSNRRHRSSGDCKKFERERLCVSIYDEDVRRSLLMSRRGSRDLVERHLKPFNHTTQYSYRTSPDSGRSSSELRTGSSGRVTSAESIIHTQTRSQSDRSEGECTPSPPRGSLRSRLRFLANQEVAGPSGSPLTKH